MNAKELTLVGNTNDLLNISENGEMKMTRLFNVDENNELNVTSVSLELWSDDKTKEHTIFNQFLDKKIEITIKIIE